MEASLSSSAAFRGSGGVVEAHKKSKKHKKRHKHDRHESAAGMDDVASGQEGPIKIRIRVGGEEGGDQKKKKKKKNKDKDKEKKHKHKHKDRKRTREDTEEGAAVAKPATDDSEIPAKRIALEATTTQTMTPVAKPPLTLREREQRSCVIEGDKIQRKALNKLLDHLCIMLEKKDSNGFFSNPVTDQIAPGYSQIIKQPMDFFTMRTKLDAGSYANLKEFLDDFELICTNAMTYNQKDTIFYKAAKKLLQVGQNLTSPKKLLQLREQLPFMRTIPSEEMGFDINSPGQADMDDDDDDDSRDVSKVIEDIREIVKRPLGRFEAVPDDANPQEILEQARKAAQGAANRLKIHRPGSQLGFLRQKTDGTTSLSFLPGGEGVVPGTEKDRPVTLGALIGRVKSGTGSIQGFREDRRNVAKAAHPLYYGAYSSHGPTYDSTFANLTKEETDLVYSTYGDEVGVQYAESILNFSRNCDYAMFIVDHLLDILTQNEHRKTCKYIEEEKMLRREDELLNVVFKDAAPSPGNEEENVERSEEGKKEDPHSVDFTSLKSLSEEGIDVSFLEGLRAQYLEDPALQLQETANLLDELKHVQLERLSLPSPQHMGHAPRAGDKEQQLADSIRTNLTHLVRNFKPTDVVPEESLHKLLGLPDKIKKESEDCAPNEQPGSSVPVAGSSDVEMETVS